jgi:hypothetical protein
MKHLRYFLSAFLAEGVLAFFRLSLLWGAMGWLLATSSVGQYFTSTMHAHDLQRSARWATEEAARRQPVVVLIDDAGYESFFSGQSPVSRSRMRELLQTIADNTSRTTRVVLDIDVSPVKGQEVGQAALERMFESMPGRWVLPAPKVSAAAGSGGNESAGWRKNLCGHGVGFGLPYVPTEFGYPLPTHQFVNGLADAATQTPIPCADPSLELVRKDMPLQGAMLDTGLVLPFGGDLNQLGELLRSINPPMVFVGGAWGHLDMFGTPFGERYGVQVHAAAAAAALAGEHMASPLEEMVLIWMFCGFIGALRGLFYEAVDQERMEALGRLPGHAFWLHTGRPILFFVWVFFLVIGFSEVLAIWHAYTGYWVSTGNVAVFTICSVLMSWGAGRTRPQSHNGIGHAWREVVVQPIRQDAASVRHALGALSGNRVWHPPGVAVPLTRWESVREGLLALARLAAETLLPFVSLVYALKELA